VWRRGFLGPSDRNGLIRIVNDGLVRFSKDGANVEMKYAESVEPNADFTEWTINLREGGKWSDGEPFTADDIMFWFNDVDQQQGHLALRAVLAPEQGRLDDQGREG
jgi:peptide/nickel transport system substrate-binding protein